MKRIKPLYKQLVKAGKDNLFIDAYKWLITLDVEKTIIEDSDLVMSPYSEFIPLQYLFFNSSKKLAFRTAHIAKPVYDKISTGLMRDMLSYEQSQNENNFENDVFLNNIFKWAALDGATSVREIDRNTNRAWNESVIVRDLNNVAAGFKFCGRGWRTLHTPYSLYLNKASNLYYDFSPEVLAVILPENYLYQKYKILMDGCIDMSKVIILVNRDLSTSAYNCPPFKKFWRKYMMASVMKSGADVWEVPREYIQENCFLKKFSLSGMNIFERKKAKEDIINAFCEYMQEDNPNIGSNVIINTAAIPPNEYIMMDGNGLLSSNFTATTSRNPLEQMVIDSSIINIDFSDGRYTWTSPYVAGVDPISQEPVSSIDRADVRTIQMEYNTTMDTLRERIRAEYPLREEDTMPADMENGLSLSRIEEF